MPTARSNLNTYIVLNYFFLFLLNIPKTLFTIEIDVSLRAVSRSRSRQVNPTKFVVGFGSTGGSDTDSHTL